MSGANTRSAFAFTAALAFTVSATACQLKLNNTLSTTGPAVTVSEPSSNNVQAGLGVVTYTVTYSRATNITLSHADIILFSDEGADCTKAVSGAGSTTRTVTLTHCTTSGGAVEMKIVPGTATDGVGKLSIAAKTPTKVLVVAGPATQVVFTLQPTNSSAGQSINPSPVVQIQDLDGNRVTTSNASIAVSLLANPGSATLGGTKTLSAVNGQAVFTGLTLDKLATGYTLQAVSTGLTSATSTPFNNLVGSPTTLAFTLTNAKSLMTSKCSTALTLQSRDTAGNVSPIGSALAIDLSAGGPGAALFYTTPLCTGSAVTQVSLASSTSEALFYMKYDTAQTSVAVTASGGTSSGLTDATLALKVVTGTNAWTALPAAPSGLPIRFVPGSVWTGTEMIVWGGSNGSYLASGARYNPSTNAWTMMSSLGAPSARQEPHMVWTGNEVIVWGGTNSIGDTQNGALYNPGTDTWRAMTTPVMSVGRSNSFAQWTGTEMIVWGGLLSGSNVAVGARYSPTTNAWTAMATLGAPSARRNHASAWTGTEYVTWGGYGPSSSLGDGARYNPRTNSWTPITALNAPAATWYNKAIWTGKEVIFWSGGSFSKYNPVTDVWTALSSVGSVGLRYSHVFVWTGTEMIAYAGKDGSTYVALGDGARYNPTTNLWTVLPTSGAPSARGNLTGVWTGTEIIGWAGYTGSAYLNDGGRYSPP